MTDRSIPIVKWRSKHWKIRSIYNNIYEILENINTYIPTSNFGRPRPHALQPPPSKKSGYASRPIGWNNSESTVTVLPWYFFTVLTVAHNRWYRPTLHCFLKIWFNERTHPNERRNGQQPSLIFMTSMGSDQSALRTWPYACAVHILGNWLIVTSCKLRLSFRLVLSI